MLSQAQERSLAIVPKVSAFPSIIGSLYIVVDIARDAKKRKSTHHRLIFSMSLVDALTSTFFFLSTWPAPASSGLYLASGNEQTCAAQGFILSLGIIVPIYNLGLTIYSYLVACATDKKFAASVRRIEPILHVIPWTAGLGISIAGLVLGAYGNSLLWCWIDDDFAEFRIYAFYLPVLLCICASIVTMGLMYRAVRKQENKMARYAKNYATDSEVQRKLSRKVATQAYLYAGGFLLTWTFATITRFIQLGGEAHEPIPYTILVLWALTLPAQGFFHCLVYNRRSFIKHRKNLPDGCWQWFLRSCRCRGCCRGKDSAPTGVRGSDIDDEGGETDPCDALRSFRDQKSRHEHSKTEVVDGESASPDLTRELCTMREGEQASIDKFAEEAGRRPLAG